MYRGKERSGAVQDRTGKGRGRPRAARSHLAAPPTGGCPATGPAAGPESRCRRVAGARAIILPSIFAALELITEGMCLNLFRISPEHVQLMSRAEPSRAGPDPAPAERPGTASGARGSLGERR